MGLEIVRQLTLKNYQKVGNIALGVEKSRTSPSVSERRSNVKMGLAQYINVLTVKTVHGLH